MSEGPIDFIAVGPQRTGTTWLYERLQRHTALYLPGAVKETMFFDRRYERGLEWYRRYFAPSENDQLRGEVAPTYFDVPEVPERVHDVAPNCDIIISLRHPAERAFSLYLHHLRKGRVRGSFRDAIEKKGRILTAGRYATHIPRWRSTFGPNQVHFLFLHDIRSRPQYALDQVCQWLGVKPMTTSREANEKVNKASMPRFPQLAKGAARLTRMLHSYGLHHLVGFGKKIGLRDMLYTGGEEDMPELTDADREFLIREYEDDIAYVENVTGRNLPEWRE